MKNLRHVLMGSIIALASLGLVLGSFSLSLAEGNVTTTVVPEHTLTPSDSPTLELLTPSMDSPTPPPALTLTPSTTQTLTPSSTLTFTWTPIPSSSPTNCPPPEGWLPYIFQSGDTLIKIAAQYRIGITELQQANCLATSDLLPGMVIYVPPFPTQTPLPALIRTAAPCGPPSGWVIYIIQPNDNLYRLSLAYGISIAQLQQANCMGSSILLKVGQKFFVPPWPPLYSSPTPPIVIPPIVTSTNTPEPSLPSNTPTEAPTSNPTDTPVFVASDTPIEIPTDTLMPTIPVEVPTETMTPPGP
jgi:LysM repeat protein